MVTVLRRTLVIWVYTVVLRDQEFKLTKLGNYPKIIVPRQFVLRRFVPSLRASVG